MGLTQCGCNLSNSLIIKSGHTLPCGSHLSQLSQWAPLFLPCSYTHKGLQGVCIASTKILYIPNKLKAQQRIVGAVDNLLAIIGITGAVASMLVNGVHHPCIALCKPAATWQSGLLWLYYTCLWLVWLDLLENDVFVGKIQVKLICRCFQSLGSYRRHFWRESMNSTFMNSSWSVPFPLPVLVCSWGK